MSADATQNGQITAEPPKNVKIRAHATWRTSVAERREIVVFIRELIALGARHGEIKTRTAERFKMSRRSVERYESRARKEIVEETGRSRSELRGEAAEVYRTILRDDTANHFAKMKAQERIDKLFGLESPQQIEHSGKDGGPLTFAAIMASAERSAPAIEADAGNVVDVDAELAKIRAAHG